MNINDVHKTILYFVNKEQNAFITPAEIDLVLDKAQLVLFNQYHTNPKLPSNVQAKNYGDSQRIDDALSAFKSKYTFTSLTSPSGVVTLPADYMHLISLFTTVYNAQLGRNVYSSVQVMNEEELIERLESQVIPVTADDPIAIMNSQNRIQLFPEAPATGGVYYFKRPAVPVFGYTQSGRTITYNPLTSTQLEWRDADIMNIIVIALSYYGLNMSSEMIAQFANVKEVQGQ
jgi:hypothetical protein